MHFRCNHTKLTTTEEKQGVHVFLFFSFLFFFCFALPASVWVIAWKSSVSLDIACVGPSWRWWQGWWWWRWCQRGRSCGPDPCSLGWRTPFELWTPVTPFKGLPPHNSCSECVMEIARYNRRSVCLLLSPLRPLQWTLNTLLHYTLPGLWWRTDW